MGAGQRCKEALNLRGRVPSPAFDGQAPLCVRRKPAASWHLRPGLHMGPHGHLGITALEWTGVNGHRS